MADWKWGDQFNVDDDDNEDADDARPAWQWGSRDGIVFLVDCSRSMFEAGDQEETAFEQCIQCCRSLIQSKIISSDKDLLALVFFATEKSKNSTDFKNIYVFHDLDQPGAERVLQLEALLDEPDNNDFTNTYGHSDTYSLSDALWACSNIFSSCSQKLGFKRVLLFTNNDNPHPSNAQLRRQAAAKAGDLHQNSIDVELCHMQRANAAHPFDYATFYKDVLVTDEDGDAMLLPDATEKIKELLIKVRSKDHKKRAMCRLPLALGPALQLAVGVYNLVRTCYKPAAVKLYKKTNEELKSVSKTFLQENGEVLLPQDVKKSQIYGGKQILFESEELVQMKRFDKPGINLMGFKPCSCLKRYFHVKPAHFIYPDESVIQGSTTAFTALLKKCVERDVVAICSLISRRNTPPRFVALLPQAEELDEHRVQQRPPGFHVIFLPFADDLRKVKFDDNLPRASTEQIDKAKEIVKKAKSSYACDMFDNPALQQHYNNVEAMALDRDAPDTVTDVTMPHDKLADRLREASSEFKDLVFPEDYVPGKRKAGYVGSAAKKPRIEVEVDMKKEAKDGKLGKLTVAVLRDYCKMANIAALGNRKADLIDAISAHFGL